MDITKPKLVPINEGGTTELLNKVIFSLFWEKGKPWFCPHFLSNARVREIVCHSFTEWNSVTRRGYTYFVESKVTDRSFHSKVYGMEFWTMFFLVCIWNLWSTKMLGFFNAYRSYQHKNKFFSTPYSWHYACQILLHLKSSTVPSTPSKLLSFHWEVGTNIYRSRDERTKGSYGWHSSVWVGRDKNRCLNDVASELGLKDEDRLS